MKISHLMLLAASLILMGCGDTVGSLARVVDVEPSGWYTPAEITFEVSDTTSYFDMQLLMRYDSYISTDVVELLVSTTAPDGVMWCEEFSIPISIGDRSIHSVETCYRRSIVWGQCGLYKVSLKPLHLYRGISVVGVNIINNEN